MENIYQKIREKLEKSERVLILSHKGPDGDTLGANIAMKIALQRMQKQVVSACIDELGPRFEFLPLSHEFVKEFDKDDFDTMIFVDCGASYMSDFQIKYLDLFEFNGEIINIDHHISNDNFGTLNWVDPDSACVTVMLYRLFKALGIQISKNIATCLLAGIYNDTGCFRHSNTTEEVYEIAAELVQAGAKVGEISKYMFHSTPLKTLKAWGEVLQRAELTEKNFILSAFQETDFSDFDPEDVSGVVDYLSQVPGSRFGFLVHEDRKGNVKGSFRAQSDDVDVSMMARELGGGGHKKASGFSLPGKLDNSGGYKIISPDLSKKSLDF